MPGFLRSGQLEGNPQIDAGLRIALDIQGYLTETYGRYPNFSPTTPNPNVDNLPGAMIFERDGVEFAKVYPYAFGPRLEQRIRSLPRRCFAPDSHQLRANRHQ